MAQLASNVRRRLLPQPPALAPGLALTVGIATLAILIQPFFGTVALSPLMVAMALGIVTRNTIGLAPSMVPGVKFGLRRLLRLAIMLLGFQLTYSQLADVGLLGFSVVACTLVASFVFIKVAGRMLGVAPTLTELIAAGTAVCGASAVVATNTVTRGSDEDVAYAIACVTFFGSLSMLLFPLLGPMMGLHGAAYGLWVGASVHEVAQVSAAAFQAGLEAAQSGTISKLSRVILLAPLILILSALGRRRGRIEMTGAPPMPWFVFGFVAVVIINSILPLQGITKELVVTATTFLLTIALASMGLETDASKLLAKGGRAFILGALGWLFISVFAFCALQLL